MPQWIEQRKEHLLKKNPNMPESMAWGLATQQAHALGKTPKGYGTAEGRREAKRKYDEPKKSYVQTAKPKTAAFRQEFEKLALAPGTKGALIGAATLGALGAIMAYQHNKKVPPEQRRSLLDTSLIGLGASLGGLGGQAWGDIRSEELARKVDSSLRAASASLAPEAYSRDHWEAFYRGRQGKK